MSEPTNYQNEPVHYQPQQEESNLFNTQPTINYAGFGVRFAAYLIDGILLAIVVYILSMLFGGNEITVQQHEGFGYSWRIEYFNANNLLSTVAGWLYFAVMESSPGQATLGKNLLGIKVTGMDGERISFLNATGRHFAKIISTMILFIGFLMVIWTDKKQGLHDMLAKTLVVRK